MSYTFFGFSDLTIKTLSLKHLIILRVSFYNHYLLIDKFSIQNFKCNNGEAPKTELPTDLQGTWPTCLPSWEKAACNGSHSQPCCCCFCNTPVSNEKTWHETLNINKTNLTFLRGLDSFGQIAKNDKISSETNKRIKITQDKKREAEGGWFTLFLALSKALH